MIRNIIFDIGMVLVDFHWERTMSELGFSSEVISYLGKNMLMHPDWKELDLNIHPETEVVQRFKAHNPGYETYIDTFFSNIDEIVTTFDGADTFMQELKEQGYRIYLLSNYPERMYEIHKHTRFTFYPYIDGEVVSYQYKLAKPDPAIYKLLCQKYSLLPQECIFLDDREENISAAKALGMEGIVVTDPFKAREELRLLLDTK
ncbi:MAG: HAD family hydrolase [Wujia sp.]